MIYLHVFKLKEANNTSLICFVINLIYIRLH